MLNESVWKKPMPTETEWNAIWATDVGKKFRAFFALFWTRYPPNKPPEEPDYRTYWLPLRSMLRWPSGIDAVVRGMEQASQVGGNWRPSAGSIRACALASLPDPGAQRALPARRIEPCDPLTVPELAQMREGFSRMNRQHVERVAEPRDSIYRRAVELAELWGANYLQGTRH
jgi:hypothetical protein